MLKLIKHDLPDTLNKLKLYAISDLHVGEKSFDKTRFRNFVKMISEDNEAYCVLAGDLLNNALKSSVSDVYNEDMPPSQALRYLKKELEPIKGKILAIVSGNHENRSKKETDIDLIENLAESLGILGVYHNAEIVVKLLMGKSGNGRKQMYSVYVTHGANGGKALGSVMNATEKLSMSVNADIYIVGHAHKKIAGKHEYRHVDLTHETVTERERLFVVSSHWAKYFGGYASRMCLQPSAKGAVPIILYSKRKHFEAII